MNAYSTSWLTAIAPIIWGSTYFVTTEFLPDGYPLTIAMLRALPAGILLLIIVRRLPSGKWWLKSLLLGGLNFSIFWSMLFIAAYRLPGGIAATIGAIQPLVIIILGYLIYGSPIHHLSLSAAVLGVGGIALLVISPDVAFDPMGLTAGVIGAVSMAIGTILTHRWKPPVSLLTFTSWQLIAGGILLLPLAMWIEPPLPSLSKANITGLIYLSLIGAALTYTLWFRGLFKLDPSIVSVLGFLSPVSAILIGWLLLGQSLNATQILAVIIVLITVWLSQINSHQ